MKWYGFGADTLGATLAPQYEGAAGAACKRRPIVPFRGKVVPLCGWVVRSIVQVSGRLADEVRLNMTSFWDNAYARNECRLL